MGLDIEKRREVKPGPLKDYRPTGITVFREHRPHNGAGGKYPHMDGESQRGVPK